MNQPAESNMFDSLRDQPMGMSEKSLNLDRFTNKIDLSSIKDYCIESQRNPNESFMFDDEESKHEVEDPIANKHKQIFHSQPHRSPPPQKPLPERI